MNLQPACVIINLRHHFSVIPRKPGCRNEDAEKEGTKTKREE